MAPKSRAGRPAGSGGPSALAGSKMAQFLGCGTGYSSHELWAKFPTGACVGAEERGQVFYRDRAAK